MLAHPGDSDVTPHHLLVSHVDPHRLQRMTEKCRGHLRENQGEALQHLKRERRLILLHQEREGKCHIPLPGNPGAVLHLAVLQVVLPPPQENPVLHLPGNHKKVQLLHQESAHKTAQPLIPNEVPSPKPLQRRKSE